MTQAFSSTLSVWPKDKRQELRYAVEARELIALTAPITGTALINMGMSITDTVMMGWSGPEALAAGAVVSDLYSRTVAGRSDPCAKPQAATAPSYLMCESTLASVRLPTESTAPGPALLPQWATGLKKLAERR